jgi:outer membrane protein assembly factor BamB
LRKSVKYLILLALIVLLSPNSTLWTETLAQSATNGDWATFNHDSSHTGYSPSAGPNTNQTLWTFTTGDKVESSPVVANGVVYVGSDDGYFYALNASNGELIWKYNTYGPIQSAATVVDGVVYFGGFHSHAVFALNAYTGDLIWNSPTTSIFPNEISSTTVGNGLVYIEVNNDGSGGELLALNSSTGSTAWKYSPSAWLSTTPALYGDELYVGVPGRIVALNASSGEVNWQFLVTRNGPNANMGDGAYSGASSLSIDQGLLFVGTSVQTIQAWNASTGALVWIGNIEGAVYYSTVAVANGKVYASTTWGGIANELKPPGVTALSEKTGEHIWSSTLASIMHSSPAVADNMVFVGSDNIGHPPSDSYPKVADGGSVYALNAQTGATIWSYSTGDEVYSSPAMAYGIVYVGSNDGKIYAIGKSEAPQVSPTPAIPELSWLVILPFLLSSFSVAFIARDRRIAKSEQ